MAQSTRERLLEVADAIFQRNGFHATTVHAIAGSAGANVAAISYYFGSKAGLYVELIRRKLKRTIKLMPRLSDAPDDPSGQLHAFIQWHFERHRAEHASLALNPEISIPPEFAETMFECVVRPEFEACAEIVAAMRSQPLDSDEVRRSTQVVIGMCKGAVVDNATLQKIYPNALLNPNELEKLSELAADFAIRALSSREVQPAT